MRYDLTPAERDRLARRLRNIPEIRDEEVAQMMAYASSVVCGSFPVVELPPHPYESRFDK